MVVVCLLIFEEAEEYIDRALLIQDDDDDEGDVTEISFASTTRGPLDLAGFRRDELLFKISLVRYRCSFEKRGLRVGSDAQSIPTLASIIDHKLI